MGVREQGRKLTPPVARAALAILSLAVVPLARATAQERESPAASEAEARRPNSIGLFMGATAKQEEETAFTIGLDYERRLGEQWGVGVILDKPFGGSRSFLVVAGLFWHPLPRVRLDVAPGIEVNRDEDELFVLRLGADYDFELNERWSIAPNVNLDIVGGRTVWVIGAELGYRF